MSLARVAPGLGGALGGPGALISHGFHNRGRGGRLDCMTVKQTIAAWILKAIGWRAGKLPEVLATVASLATFLVMIALLFVGHFGTQDPLANPLPLMVWTLWWIGLTVAHTLFGNLWSAMNPWRGITDFLARVPGLTSRISRPPLP